MKFALAHCSYQLAAGKGDGLFVDLAVVAVVAGWEDTIAIRSIDYLDVTLEAFQEDTPNETRCYCCPMEMQTWSESQCQMNLKISSALCIWREAPCHGNWYSVACV